MSYQLKPEYSLDPHQEDAVGFVDTRPRGGACLWLATGVGKGFISIELICRWLNEGLERILVSPPANLTVDWQQKLTLYAGVTAAHWDKAGPDDKVRIVSHALLQKQPKKDARRRDRVAEIVAWQPQAMIVDEIDALSNYKALQTKGLMEVEKRCPMKYRIGMTGTEATRIDPEQLRPQLLFADRALLQRYDVADWLGWRKKFCKLEDQRMGNVVREVVVGLKNKELLDEILSQVCLKMDDSVLKLDEPIFEEIHFRRSARSLRYYDLMEKKGAILEDGIEITTDNPLTKANRLLQIRSGFVADWEGKIHDIDDEIVKAIVGALKILPKPALILYHFTYTGDRLAAALRQAGYRLDQMKSGVSAKKKSGIEAAFQAGQLDIVLGQFAAMSVGYTMTAGHTTLYAEPEINLRFWLQSLGRTRRRGQTQQCSYFKFIGTPMDRDWYKALEDKQDFKSMISSGAYQIGRTNG